MADTNPIRWVAPYTPGSAIPTTGVSVVCPSKYQYSLQDISQADAGRTEDTTMHKLRLGQCAKVQLEWQNISGSNASAILQAFNSEYIAVNFLDPYFNAYRTTVFYVGDRSAPMYSAILGLWSNVAFNIIERTGYKV